MTYVIIESPYAGNVEENMKYLKECVRDCISRGEIPFASHGFYTQYLNDDDPEERKTGMRLGFEIGKLFEKTVIYTDRGVSKGMCDGIEAARKAGRDREYRKLYDRNDNATSKPPLP